MGTLPGVLGPAPNDGRPDTGRLIDGDALVRIGDSVRRGDELRRPFFPGWDILGVTATARCNRHREVLLSHTVHVPAANNPCSSSISLYIISIHEMGELPRLCSIKLPTPTASQAEPTSLCVFWWLYFC